MSLIKCPECGHDVSDVATACPACGFPMATQEERAKEVVEENFGKQVILDQDTYRPYYLRALIALLLYIFGFYFAGVIANLIFLSSARKYRLRTGKRPPGEQILWWMLLIFFTIPFVVVVFLLFAKGMSILEIFAAIIDIVAQIVAKVIAIVTYPFRG